MHTVKAAGWARGCRVHALCMAFVPNCRCLPNLDGSTLLPGWSAGCAVGSCCVALACVVTTLLQLLVLVALLAASALYKRQGIPLNRQHHSFC